MTDIELLVPESLPYAERYNVCALFACLVRAEGPHRRQNLKLLKKLFAHLALTPDDQQSLVGLTRGNCDPTRFAAAIREDRTGLDVCPPASPFVSTAFDPHVMP